MEAHTRPVSGCLDQVRQIVSQGVEFLSVEEVHSLEDKGKDLKSRYERATDHTDKLLRKMSAALDELHKFRVEIGNFRTWLGRACGVADEKKQNMVANLSRVSATAESTREFVSDVIAHQADLRFITMAAQKFISESMEYLGVLNEFRDHLPQRLRHIEPTELTVKAEVADVTAQYQVILVHVLSFD